jgi:hypothetical protein
LVVFLIASFIAVGREFWIARGLDKAYPLGRVSLAVPLAVFGAEHFTSIAPVTSAMEFSMFMIHCDAPRSRASFESVAGLERHLRGARFVTAKDD